MNKNSNKKEVSMDELALMIAKGFNEVNEKIEKIRTDINRVEDKFDNFEANLNKKVDKIDHNTLSYRVDKLEEKIA